jgi:hypothetical protein
MVKYQSWRLGNCNPRCNEKALELYLTAKINSSALFHFLRKVLNKPRLSWRGAVITCQLSAISYYGITCGLPPQPQAG